LNIKTLEFTSRADEFIEYRAKPNFKVLGKRFGSSMPKVSEALSNLSSDAVRAGLERAESEITVDGVKYRLSTDEVQVETLGKGDFAVASEKNFAVALDVKITPELRAEGIAREAVNRIQNTRKEAGLEVTDRIILSLVSDDDEIVNALKKHTDSIAADTLAVEVKFAPLEDATYSKEWKLGSSKLVIMLKKADWKPNK